MMQPLEEKQRWRIISGPFTGQIYRADPARELVVLTEHQSGQVHAVTHTALRVEEGVIIAAYDGARPLYPRRGRVG